MQSVRGTLYGRRDPRAWAMRQCALDVREQLVKRLAGQRKSDALGRVQAGRTTPTIHIVKLLAELKAAKVSYEDTYRIAIAPQIRALNRLHGKDDKHAA